MRLVVVLGILALAGGLLLGVTALSRVAASSDGPLAGSNGSFGQTGTIANVDGLKMTHGCQMLSNEGELPITITEIELIVKDNTWSVDQGPMMLPGLPTEEYSPHCAAFGFPTDAYEQGLLREFPDAGWILEPGEEQVGINFGITHNGSDRAVVIGHRVRYTVEGQDYQEEFRSELVICSDEAQECEPESE